MKRQSIRNIKRNDTDERFAANSPPQLRFIVIWTQYFVDAKTNAKKQCK